MKRLYILYKECEIIVKMLDKLIKVEVQAKIRILMTYYPI